MKGSIDGVTVASCLSNLSAIFGNCHLMVVIMPQFITIWKAWKGSGFPWHNDAVHFSSYKILFLKALQLNSWLKSFKSLVDLMKKYLSNKYEGLSSDLQHPNKSLVWHTYDSSTKGSEERQLPRVCWSLNLTEPVNSRFSEWHCLKN